MIFNESPKYVVVVFGLSTFTVETIIQFKIPTNVPNLKSRKEKKGTEIKETVIHTLPCPTPENYRNAPWVYLYTEHPSRGS